ncbi:MAG: hypothetical protein O3A60_03975 [Planctomycetota bacterium]|nr:hypothetical protein [Planctomycetota bacterium]
MKLGVYGWDSQVEAIVRAACREGMLIGPGCFLPTDAGVLACGGAVATAGSWEALVDEQACDAILVGAENCDDARTAGLRRLVQAGRPLVISQPLTLSMLLAYELDMIRADVGGTLLPCLPDRQHPLMKRLVDAVEGGLVGVGGLGRLESIGLVRRLPQRSKEHVLAWLARDADLVRLLIGDPQRLSTLAGVSTDAAYASLTVEFGGEAQVPARWQVARGDMPAAELTLVGEAGQIRVTMPESTAGPAVWTWQGPAGLEEAPPFDGGEVMLKTLCERLAGGDAAVTSQAPQPPPAAWADAARAIELAETVPRSLARGRAIDLHQEEFSEMGTFKGTMASLGCGLVLVGLLILVVATVIGGIAHEAGWALGEQLMSVWPFVVLAALTGFLALQLLPLLVQSRADKK